MEICGLAFPLWVLQFDTGGRRSHLLFHLAFEWLLDLWVVLERHVVTWEVLMPWMVQMCKC